MRPIDADKTLETLEGLTELVIGEGAALVKALTFAALKSESVVPTIGGWVSVKDRLPEDGWWMVSLVNNRTGHRWKIPVIAERYKGKWDFCKIFSVNPDATVTHYMPLPESPEEVSGDG